jgi:hypothetical protein
MIGAVVCCAACIGGDNLQDLKCGYGRGDTVAAAGDARHRRRFERTRNGAGVNLLLKAYGIGVPTPEHPDPLLAPQATLMASVAKGMFGGALPWGMIAVGGLIGVAVIVRDSGRTSPLDVSRAGARGRRRHLSAARPVGADFHRRPDRHGRSHSVWTPRTVSAPSRPSAMACCSPRA